MPPIDPFPCGNGLHPCPPEPAVVEAGTGDPHDMPLYSLRDMKKYGAECAEWGKAHKE